MVLNTPPGLGLEIVVRQGRKMRQEKAQGASARTTREAVRSARAPTTAWQSVRRRSGGPAERPLPRDGTSVSDAVYSGLGVTSSTAGSNRGDSGRPGLHHVGRKRDAGWYRLACLGYFNST